MSNALYAFGFSMRKRSFVREFTNRSDVLFIRSVQNVKPGASVLLWGSEAPPGDLPEDVKFLRLEDGFLRSIGLGADLVRPVSWVIDDTGLYYDASRPSALENLLQFATPDAAKLGRAARFRERLVASGLTKYNLQAGKWLRPPDKEKVVLVAGQVETDASIALGAIDINTNLALLKAVRAARPDAWLVFKPHPDVVAGLRHPGEGEQRATDFCDEILAEGAMHQLMDQVDEVHVMTSLTGFEALLRGKPVFCYGLPFYAGWGLTHDRHTVPRRTRKLALDELVAGALLDYPTYVSRETGKHCTPEQAVEELLAWRAGAGSGLPLWRRWLRPFLSRQ